MSPHDSPPPANPDIKRELKKYLLALPARSSEFFAGDFLVYIGLEAVSVTRYIGDGGIDAQGDLLAGMFRIPTGIQVKMSRSAITSLAIQKEINLLHLSQVHHRSSESYLSFSYTFLSRSKVASSARMSPNRSIPR